MSGMFGPLVGSIFSSGGNIFSNWASNELAANTDIKAMNQYMSQWGSPAAQMASFRSAGINPYFAAQQISGNSGSTNVSSSPVQPDFAGDVADFAGAQNVVAKTPAEVRKLNAEAEGQEIENSFNSGTLDERKKMVSEGLRKLGYEADAAEAAANFAWDIQKYTLKGLKADARKKDSEAKLADKEVEYYDKQIDEIDEEIKEIQQRVKTLISEEELNKARKLLAQKEKEKLGLEIEKQKIENKKLEFDSDDLIATYNYLKDKYGEEYADKWFEDSKNKIGDITAENLSSEYEVKEEHDPVFKTQKEALEYWDKEIADVDQEIADIKKLIRDPNIKSYERDGYSAQIEWLELKKRRMVKKRSQIVAGGGASGISIAGYGIKD